MSENQPEPFAGLTDRDIDELLTHPYWEALGTDLDALIDCLPPTTVTCERTTILTWIYQCKGVMSFLELSERITGFDNISRRKKHLREYLRGLEKLMLISIVNFPTEGDAQDAADIEPGLGRNSLISLTWTGMVWLRRAWQARAKFATPRNIIHVHLNLVAEEDDGKANEPYWVENITSVDPDGSARRAQRIAEAIPAINSVFSLAQSMKSAR